MMVAFGFVPVAGPRHRNLRADTQGHTYKYKRKRKKRERERKEREEGREEKGREVWDRAA